MTQPAIVSAATAPDVTAAHVANRGFLWNGRQFIRGETVIAEDLVTATDPTGYRSLEKLFRCRWLWHGADERAEQARRDYEIVMAGQEPPAGASGVKEGIGGHTKADIEAMDRAALLAVVEANGWDDIRRTSKIQTIRGIVLHRYGFA